MSHKRTRLTAIICLVSIAAMLFLTRCMQSQVAADPMGPPTLEEYLKNIQSGVAVMKWMMGIVGGLFSALIGMIIYAYKRDMAEVKEDAAEAKKSVGDAFSEINKVKKSFLSIEGHDRGCPHRINMVEPGH